MILIFDTNLVHEDFHLFGPRISKLTSAAQKLGYDLMIPEVVVDEIINQYRKKLIQYLPGYANIMKMVTRTQGTENKFDKDAFISEKTKDYASFLGKRLKELDIEVIGYPQVDIKALVAKDLTVKKPFKEKEEGNIGYRDALIWESIKSVCQPPKALIDDPQVEFLTENTKDFAGANNILHPDLVEDLKKTDLAENCITLVPDVKSFFETKIDVELERLDQIKEALETSGKYNRFDIQDEVSRILTEDYVTEVLDESDSDSGERYPLPGYMEVPSCRNAYSPTIDDVTVCRLSDQTVLIEVAATVSVDLEFYVYKADYFMIDEDRIPYIIDGDWNDHYMWCEESLDIPFRLSFRTTPKLGKILSVDVLVEDVLK